MPSVPKNETTTDAISTSGATIACSRTPRISAITSSAIGTITFRSRAGRLVEVVLDRRAAADQRARARAERRRGGPAGPGTLSSASDLYGSSSKIASKRAMRPSRRAP